MKKQAIISMSIIFLVLLISSISADYWMCFDKGKKIDFCNPKIQDRISPNNGYPICMSKYDETKECYTPGSYLKCLNGPAGCSIFGNDSDMDYSAPNLTINNPIQDGIYNSRSILVDFTLDEESDVSYLDIVNGRGRWTRVCQDCYEYSNRRSFDEGWNNLTFKAVDGIGNEYSINRSFFIDSKKPQIHKTEPRSDYASGTFDIQYTEDNLENIELIYGNDETGFRNKTITDCFSGKKQWCSVDVDLDDYNGQRIKYYFIVRDIAKNEKQSQIRQNLIVDTIAPVLNNPPIFWSYTSGDRYVYFKLNVTEENLDKIEYKDNSASKPIWKTLCSRLKKGICEAKKAFGKGYHNIDVQITDKAGNAIAVSTGQFNVNY